MLARIEAQALFLTRVDGGSGWYRLHGLFREVLRHRLRLRGIVHERSALTRAAAWHLARDEADEAAPLLIEAEDWDGVVAAVRSFGNRYFQAGRARTVMAWLEAVPQAVRATDPMTAMEHGALATMVGNTQEGEAAVASITRSPTATAAVMASFIRSTWVDDMAPPDRIVAWCDEGLAALAADLEIPDVLGITSRSSVEFVLNGCAARALTYDGRHDEARQRLQDLVVHLGGDETFGPWAANLQASLALLHAWTGHLRAAEGHYARAMRHVAGLGSAAHPALAYAHLAMGQTLLERNELDRADLVLAEGRAHALRNGRSLPVVLHAIARARRLLDGQRGPATGPMIGAGAATHLAAGDPATASRLLATAVVDPADQRSAMERDLWQHLVAMHAKAQQQGPPLTEVLDRAEVDGHIRLFLDGGPPVARALRDRFEREPTPWLRRLTTAGARPAAASSRSAASSAANRTLVEPLSQRELTVLGYLATRSTNAEIAANLYISVNTLKTHLRHIYGKLGVNGRRDAVTRAEATGLI